MAKSKITERNTTLREKRERAAAFARAFKKALASGYKGQTEGRGTWAKVRAFCEKHGISYPAKRVYRVNLKG